MREPVAESFAEVSTKPGSSAALLHLYLPEALQSNKLEIQSIHPHGVYTHLHILLHIIDSKETPMLSSLILDQAISLKELHRHWKN